MALEDKKQPIVVKKIKKGGHGHHGGAWKVAYADFVTAMMAFFLLMWLLGSTTQEERAAIADYFQNPSAIQGPGGASTSMIKLGGSLEVPRGEKEPMRDASGETAKPTPEEIAEIIEDKARLDELMQKLKEQIESTPTLKDFKDQLLLDITSEGLRIQIVDRENRPMFDLGSTRLKPYTRAILRELTRTINEVPNHISLTGHTDATPYSREITDYSNWELSADRANAARREMLAAGMPERKFGRVVGLADSVMFDKENRFNPVNRRISIVVLNKATERAIGLTDEAPVVAPRSSATPPLPTVVPPAPVAPPVAAPEPAITPAIMPRPAPRGNSMENAIEGVLGPAPIR
ncbi:flagellar motor protein MotB [Sulfurivermis fontis]|uniref:flagellar motor protein MotB n=1 Tax=Sulfurivermis fontis TaxID=1972068 RepID=UPI000FDC92AD|nr:flagellar motor protein MotB [Sulfurivermis fontis]